jgi:hypothetical protein
MLTTTAVSRSLLLRHGRQTLKAASSSIGSRPPNSIHSNNHDYHHHHPHDSRRPCFSPPHQRQQLSFQSTAAVVPAVVSGRDAYQVSETLVGPDACTKVGLSSAFGIVGPTTIYRNLTYAELFEQEIRNNEGNVVAAEYGDTFAVDTGKYTGRSPKDRWIVLNAGSETAEHLDWNDINRATTPEVFDELLDKCVKHFNTRETAYVFDGYCGASPATRKKVRFVHEMAWQQHFGMYGVCFIVYWNSRD